MGGGSFFWADEVCVGTHAYMKGFCAERRGEGFNVNGVHLGRS